jgi:hypothetical protein
MITKNRLTRLGSVRVGDSFIYRTSEICELIPFRLPGFEGQMLTVVGFPQIFYQVIVREPNGRNSLLSLSEVERALGRYPKKQTIADNPTAQVL